MLRLNGTNEWEMNLAQIPGAVSNIKEVNVLRNIIVMHCGNTYCNYKEVQEAWFVIAPKRYVEKGFERKEDFYKYLSSMQIDGPKLYNVNRVFDEFSKKKDLDWASGFN